jgi:hypothetical protein
MAEIPYNSTAFKDLKIAPHLGCFGIGIIVLPQHM